MPSLLLSRNATVSAATAESTLKANVLSPGTASKDGRVVKIVYAGKY